MRLPALLLSALLLASQTVSAARESASPAPREIAYGSDPRQRLDLYLPSGPDPAPLLWMVHGGAWRLGDKRNDGVIEQKLQRWRPKGFALISVNYRLLPGTPVAQQLEDLRLALRATQTQAGEWGIDPTQVVLLGHSAGAHLLALLQADPQANAAAGLQPWLGSILLDSAALDLPAIMQAPHYRFYDKAFGHDPADWRRLSPLHQLSAGTPPLLAVCSSQRPDHPCRQAHTFVARIGQLGGRASVLEQPLSHRDINQLLGEDNRYTREVEAFIGSLDPRLQRRLQP